MLKKLVLSFVAGVFLLPSLIFAQPPFSGTSDILGLKLSMTLDEALEFLKTNYNVVASKELKQQLGTSDYKTPELLLGYKLTITPKDEQDQNNAQLAEEKESAQRAIAAGIRSPGQMVVRENQLGGDVIKISLDPTDPNRIIAISRERTFRPDDMPLEQVFFNTIIEKYGKPTVDTNSSGTSLTHGLVDGIWSDLVMPPTGRKWDNAGQENFYRYWSCEQVTSLVADIDMQLANIVNQIDTSDSLKTSDKCGTTMMLKNVNRGKSQEYIGSFKMLIADVGQSVKSIKKFKADFIAQTQKAEQNRLNKDSQKKPQL
jgi:hypothetical protein